MAAVDRLAALLPGSAGELVGRHGARLTEIRLRAGRPVQLRAGTEELMSENALEEAALEGILAALMEYSVYARQGELDQGFFTLDDGSRVGVCGRMHGDTGALRMAGIGSVCVRVARAIPGCAEALSDALSDGGILRSTLLVSPPGLGKTTLLRDVARMLSGAGYCVGLVDERHELAACRRGVPTLDVGPRTDVMDGCPRAEAIRRMLRAMAPDAIVTDEIGADEDADALADAARCGVAVFASAHSRDIASMTERPCLRRVLEHGAIRQVALLGPIPGQVREIRRRRGGGGGEAEWCPA